MDKLTEEQLNKLRETRDRMNDLQKQSDALYDQCVEDLGFQKYLEAKRAGSAAWPAVDHNPINWLFDAFYNSSDEEEFTKAIEGMMKNKVTFDSIVD